MTPEGKLLKNPDGSCNLLASYNKFMISYFAGKELNHNTKCLFLGPSCLDCEFFKQTFQPEIMDSLPVRISFCNN